MLLTARDLISWFPSNTLTPLSSGQVFFAQRRTCAEVRAEGTLAIRARHRPGVIPNARASGSTPASAGGGEAAGGGDSRG